MLGTRILRLREDLHRVGGINHDCYHKNGINSITLERQPMVFGAMQLAPSINFYKHCDEILLAKLMQQRGLERKIAELKASTPDDIEKRRLPMNRIQVGTAPSPNLAAVRAKICSLDNTGYKPGGGDKKVFSQKLQWEANSKIGSLVNSQYKPSGGNTRIFDDKEYLRQVSMSNAQVVAKFI